MSERSGVPHADATSRLSRRGLLSGLAAGSALATLPASEAVAAPARHHKPNHRPHHVRVPHDQALHALRRLGYGPSPADLKAVRATGPSKWLNQQLQPGVDRCAAQLELIFPLLTQGPRAAELEFDGDAWAAVEAYEWATLLRTMYTSRPVEARLTEVWLDHFNVSTAAPKPFLPWTRFEYDYRVVRPRASGPFAELLKAVLVSPAMLGYLDQWLSTKELPGENLARESLELHTVGVGHFNEHDVKQYAKLLTGLTVDVQTLQFEYDPSRHHTGHLEILGFKTSNRSRHGLATVHHFAEYLAHHPRTAQNVARRLLVHYVEDHPSRHLVDRVARHYLKHGTDIGETLKFIVEQDEFFASRGRKARRPSEWFAAAVRGLGWTLAARPSVRHLSHVSSWKPYLGQLRAAGHAPGEWLAPNGYPQVNAAWTNSNTMLHTWGLLATTVDPTQRGPFVKSAGPAAAAWSPGATIDEIIKRAAFQITGQEFDKAHRHAIAALIKRHPSDVAGASWRTGAAAAHELIHFAICASEYMEVR
ncbi:MAG: DUF1800 domain-containing protein [Frankiaceae bacterium]|nr:DUF1800 domain-containing protein [Frankiaceae bacterium]MBV9871488.1 DUF1800 domain-containing protein [Frankiaceae bacterium]